MKNLLLLLSIFVAGNIVASEEPSTKSECLALCVKKKKADKEFDKISCFVDCNKEYGLL